MQSRDSTRAGAGGCQVLVSPCWDPELGPAPQPVLVLLSQKRLWKPQGALSVCLDCSRPQSQQKQIVSLWLRFLQPALGQECCLTSGTPTSCPQKWGMCVTVPLAALPRFQSDILLSCQTVMAFAAAELRFWSHLVFLGDGPEHLGPFCTF